MFGRKGKDKDANKGKSEATKSTGTIKGAVGTDPKSPRADNGGADDLSNAGQVETADDGVLTFVVGDTRLALTHKKLLNDQAFFDMELQLGGQHKKVAASHVHRAVLQVRCPALLMENKFVSRIDKSKARWHATINDQLLPHMTPTVLNQLLQWVYGGTMEHARFALNTLLDVCATAVALSLEEVVWTCEHRVREILNIDSVHVILKGSEDRGLQGVKSFALAYAFDHWNDFIGNQEGAKILGLELFQDVSAKYAKGERTAHPEGPQPPNNIVSDYRRLYEEMPMADMQIDVAGKKLNCHRAIVGMYADGLANRLKSLLKSPNLQPISLIDSKHESQDLRSSAAVESFLRFVYYGETKMDPIDACEMIHKVNSVYRLNTFQLLCEHTIIHNINPKSVLHILGVTYIKIFESKQHIQLLRKHAFAHVISRFGTVELDALSSMPPEIRTDLLVELQKAFKSGKLGQAQGADAGDDEAAVAVDSE